MFLQSAFLYSGNILPPSEQWQDNEILLFQKMVFNAVTYVRVARTMEIIKTVGGFPWHSTCHSLYRLEISLEAS